MKELTDKMRDSIIAKVSSKAESMIVSHKKGSPGYTMSELKGAPEDYSSHINFIMVVHAFDSSSSIEKRWERKRFEKINKGKNVQPRKKEEPSSYTSEHEYNFLCGNGRATS